MQQWQFINSFDQLNIFRAIICPSSEALDCGRCEGCCSNNILHTDHLSRVSASRLPADNNRGALYLKLQNIV